MMEIVLGTYFRLPRLGKDVFARLMAAGLKYDKRYGFRANERTDLVSVSSLLEGALRERVELYDRCFLTLSRTECESCSYRDVCDKRVVSPNCICNGCFEKEDAFALYRAHFASLLERRG